MAVTTTTATSSTPSTYGTTTARDIWSGLSPDTQKYYIKKGAVQNVDGYLEGITPDQLMSNINAVNSVKGGMQVYDPSQINGAASSLIAQRNKRGLSGIGGMLLPIAASIIAPGIGTALGGSLAAMIGAGAGVGGLTSALTGGNVLKGALLGGAGGAFAGSGGSFLGNAAKAKIGASGSGLLGALSNSSSSVLKGVGNALNQGVQSVNGIGSTLSGALGAGKNALGATWGTDGSGSLGNITGGSISMGNPLSSALSGYFSYKSQDDMRKQLMQGQNQALAQYSPYLASGAAANRQLSQALAAGFNPGDLALDPGYQFRLGQGQKSLNQSLAARGLGQSGAALKAAQEYGQNFANNEYADAYNRWLQNNSQLANAANVGYNAAGNAADIYGNMGEIGASAAGNKSNILSRTLSSLLSGNGIIGRDMYGNPVWG